MSLIGRSPIRIPHIQVILCANKIDLFERDLDLLPPASPAQDRGIEIMKASARTGEGSASFSPKTFAIRSQNLLEIDLLFQGFTNP
jgi:hypothetical protein